MQPNLGKRTGTASRQPGMVTRFSSTTLRQYWPPSRPLPIHPATPSNWCHRQRKSQRRTQRHPATSSNKPRRRRRSRRQPWANCTPQETPHTPPDPWTLVPPTPRTLSIPVGQFHPSGAPRYPPRTLNTSASNLSGSSQYPWTLVPPQGPGPRFSDHAWTPVPQRDLVHPPGPLDPRPTPGLRFQPHTALDPERSAHPHTTPGPQFPTRTQHTAHPRTPGCLENDRWTLAKQIP